MNAKKAKLARKEIRKEIVPMAQEEAGKLRIMQKRRPAWLPRFIYNWLSDSVIDFSINLKLTKDIWERYQCEKCLQFDSGKYGRLHNSNPTEQVLYTHFCPIEIKIVGSDYVLVHKDRMAELLGRDVALPVYESRHIPDMPAETPPDPEADMKEIADKFNVPRSIVSKN